MNKRIFTFVLSLCLVLALLPMAVFATEVETTAESTAETTAETTEETTEVVRGEFQCGEDMEWFYEEGVLTIVGTGEMDDYEKEQEPWHDYAKEITKIVFDGEISYIGSYAFYNYDKLTEVAFGDSLKEIGSYAFYDCDGLTELHMPRSFKIFGQRCFSGSNNIQEIHCEGSFPSFRDSCLWDVYCKIYFPADRAWSVTYIQQLEEAFKGRIEFLASDGSDPYVPEGATEETTEATTEATTEPTTEPATEATTEAATEEVTQPVTEEETTEAPVTEAVTQTQQPETGATEPDTTVSQETQEETREETAKEPESKAWIGVVVVGAVLVVLNVGALIFRKPKGGKYRNR